MRAAAPRAAAHVDAVGSLRSMRRWQGVRGSRASGSNEAGTGGDERAHDHGLELRCGDPTACRHVGIVFVHGIGSQQAGETLLDWGEAIVREIVDARVRHGASADPVIDVQLDAGPSGTRFIEVQLPAVTIDGTDLPEQHWVMTEAWWAHRVRPPTFAQMADWLGPHGAIRRILEAILTRRRGVHDPRLRPSVEPHALRRTGSGDVEEDATPGPPAGRSAPPGGPALRRAQSGAGGVYLQAVSALLLVLYGALRTVEKLLPIGPFKDGALTRSLDGFVLDWFGDVYVLLTDSAQAASVRGRLVDALDGLAATHCAELAIVAHSGGAIVSAMTLADLAPERVRVDRLITLGEGLNLAWRLTAGEHNEHAAEASVQYDRLYADVLARHEHLRWDDFWASQDPAPVGVLAFPERSAGEAELHDRVRSHATWNQLSFLGDHGGYWDNDEEFLIPVLRLLEGRGDGRSLFESEAAGVPWSNRRRRRLSLLSLWRQVALAAPFAAIVLAVALGTTFSWRVADLVAEAFAWIPGADVVARAVETLRGLHLEQEDPWRFAAEAGVWLLAAAIVGSTAFALKAPPERPYPWTRDSHPTWMSRLLDGLPWMAGGLVALALVAAAIQFVLGSSDVAKVVGEGLLATAAAAVILLVGALLLSVFLMGLGDRATGLADLVDATRMIVAMVLVIAFVVAPVVAILVYDQVARTAIGGGAIVILFQLLARVGGWRWSVWDARERAAMRAGRAYPGFARVLVQAAMLATAMASLFVAVVLDAPVGLGIAVVALAAVILVGVSIDVLDALREDRTRPSSSLRRHQSFEA